MTTAICVDENLVIDSGNLQLQPWAAPRLVVDVIAASVSDGVVTEDTAMPGTLLIDQQVQWTNDTPLPQPLLMRVTRASKDWITSNPNAVQFRDLWTFAVDRPPQPPVTTGSLNSQCGSAVDLATNTVAEPNAGVLWRWSDICTTDEWLQPLAPGVTFSMWYRMYRWTPPPWSDNANLNNPIHAGSGHWARIQLIAYPQQGSVVTG